MKRKEKAAVDEFVALVGGKTWVESGVDVFNDNLPKYKPSFANRNDSFLEILVSKPILSIPYDLTPLFNNAITSFSCIIEHLCLS